MYIRASTQGGQTDLSVNSAVSALDWIPGIPFYIGDLANFSLTAIGLISWILGISLVLVGLGLRARHQLARLAALAIFASAAFFQFVQFLLLGILGSPVSVVELCIDGIIVYSLLSRFDRAYHRIETSQEAVAQDYLPDSARIPNIPKDSQDPSKRKCSDPVRNGGAFSAR